MRKFAVLPYSYILTFDHFWLTALYASLSDDGSPRISLDMVSKLVLWTRKHGQRKKGRPALNIYSAGQKFRTFKLDFFSSLPGGDR